MSRGRSEFVDAALEQWRLRNVERDWQAVLARAGVDTACRQQLFVGASRFRMSWRWRLAAAVLVLAAAAPAIAAVSGVVSWPWKHMPGAELVAAVPSLPGTSLRFESHGALIVRTSHGIRFLSPTRARQQRRFVWQLTTRARIDWVEILLAHGRVAKLCSPCSDGQSGRITLAGARALDVLNGRATLKIEGGGRTTTSPIRLRQLR
jgi:hypothetical protein